MHAAFEDLYELSPLQQELLLHAVCYPASRLYVRQLTLELRGPLDAAAFRRAWQAAVDRHPALRTAFHWGKVRKPLQIVLREVELPFEEHDLRWLAPEDRRRREEELLAADRERGFDLARGPLLRLSLLRRDEEGWLLVWTYHHLVMDGWSLSIVLGDVLAVYTAGSPPWPEPAPFYRAFIAWLQQRDPAADEKFWRRSLAGFTAPTTLGIDRRPESPRGGEVLPDEVSAILPEPRTGSLQAFARRHRLTPSTLVEGAWAMLLGRYGGGNDVVYGIAAAGRPAEVAGAESTVGLFLDILPARQAVPPEMPVALWLGQVQARRAELLLHEHTPPAQVQGWSDVPRSLPLFDTLVVFENYPITLGSGSGGLQLGAVSSAAEATAYALTLLAAPGRELLVRLAYERSRFDPVDARRLLDHVLTLLTELPENAERPLSEVPCWTAAERHQTLCEWEPRVPGLPVHRRIEAQAVRTPAATALVARGRRLTYRELDLRAERLARRLRALGVGPDSRVAVCLERGADLVVALVAVLKAGGAYVPLDPAYPRRHLEVILEDSGAGLLVTRRSLAGSLPAASLRVLWWGEDHDDSTDGMWKEVDSRNLAYVLYTSGSTGRPKGVAVSHGSLSVFLDAVDERFGGSAPGVWLAVTSVCFDISVVELLWTLSRGFEVILQAELMGGGPAPDERPVGFGLFFFSSLDEGSGDRYRLLLEASRLADVNGFAAVWTPERHFHPLGGLFPNPALTGTAVAMVTENVRIRAGSVVLPLHHPARVAEEWSVVDNLSGGRAEVSFAAGWHAHDFALAPQSYRNRREVMLREIETVRRLWRGEAMEVLDGNGRPAEIRIFPRPVQPEMPVWISTSGDAEIFRQAGALGAGVITHLFGQTVDELEAKIALYRDAWRAAGHPGSGQAAVMVHTYLGEDLEAVRETVRQPIYRYLESSLGLLGGLARSLGSALRPEDLSADDLQALLGHAFDRYFAVNSFLGTPETCVRLLGRLRRAGVDEIACFIDFGLPVEAVLDSLRLLAALQGEPAEPSLTERLRSHRVTHMQCTPSLAGLLAGSPEGLVALAGVRHLLLCGEPLSPGLAARLLPGGGELHNLYGPTEATVWATAQRIEDGGTVPIVPIVPIGRPLPGTRTIVLDQELRPAPRGVPGELCLGGAGLARGYLGRPDLTAERFIPDALSTLPGARLYRTGDLARQRPDGGYDFLGRLDRQVKVRGFRIEPGQVEEALARHPAVRQCAVAARRDELEGHRLVAYVVTDTKAVQAGALRSFLQERLPEPMLPTAFVFLAGLPLLPNGKLDVASLPDPGGARPLAEVSYAPPRSELERAIAAVWQELLRLDRVGIDDNFFDLGGSSLLLFEVHNRLRERTAADLEMVSLLQHPTVRSLARHLAGDSEETSLRVSFDRAEARRASRSQRAVR